MSTGRSDRKLLLLDLDETLIHARETPLGRNEDFCVGEYFVYRRPPVDKFIDGCWICSTWLCGRHDDARL